MSTEQDELARVQLLITGQVQGVFYRASALEQAQSLNLSGQVENLPDGTVELVAEGPKWALEQLITWCKQGPPNAKVDEVFVSWKPHKGEFKTFLVLR